MKTLILVRHAKSSWEYDVGDRDRPLKNRGIIDAKSVATVFAEKHMAIDAIFSSPANRAFSTCKIFLKTMHISIEMAKIEEQLYDFGGYSVVNFVKSLDDQLEKVMIFGHNHAFTSIANTYGDKYIDNVPTSGLVMLEFDIKKWSELNQGKTIESLFPKQLRP